jgi:diacylglycerol kinase (ATP)
MTTCLVIRNPASRNVATPERLGAALQVARDAGWAVELAATEHGGHATEIARDAAARGVDVVVVHGGDGTINEVVNGIAGRRTALGVLPAGTANVWAKEIGVAKDPVRAMRQMVEGRRERVDLGIANGRYFLLMAGLGLDARIVARTGPTLKRYTGAAAYLLSGVGTALRTRPWTADLRIDGAESRGVPLYWMLVSNTRSYGGLADIMYRAHANDGLLDVAVMHHGGPLRLLDAMTRLLFKRHDRTSNIDYVAARLVEVPTPGIPVQIDGEVAGETPIRFEVAPLALVVIVPRDLETPLLGGAP